jgi:hypothetical protein
VAGTGIGQRKPPARIKIYLVVGLGLVLAALAYRYVKTKAARPGNLVSTPATASLLDIPELSLFRQESLPTTRPAKSNVREPRRDSIRDVFAPSRSLPRGKSQRPTKKGRSVQRQVTSLKLRGVIVGGKHSIAIINDKFVRIGERIDGYKVVRIAAKEVLLKSGNKTVRLRLASND